MKFENTEVWGFEHSIRGMRNPLESWSKSDSNYCSKMNCKECPNYENNCVAEKRKGADYIVGKNDLELMQKLIRAGTPHRKFLRQIFISVDITAPLYWWKEFDTYKVGIVANSTSTMHKLASTPITKECFEMDDYSESIYIECENRHPVATDVNVYWSFIIDAMENLRQKYNETKDKRYWKELIRLLPESWLQTRTITMNYENILNMITYRQNHKLSEWSESFINWVKSLPYANDLLFL